MTGTKQMLRCQQNQFGFAGAGGTDRQKRSPRFIASNKPHFSAGEDRGGFTDNMVLASQAGTQVRFQVTKERKAIRGDHFVLGRLPTVRGRRGKSARNFFTAATQASGLGAARSTALTT